MIKEGIFSAVIKWLIILFVALTIAYFLFISLIPSWISSFSLLPLSQKLAIAAIIAIALNFNILLLNLLKARRSLACSGGSAMSTRGYWTTHTGKFYMNATKRDTGEWKPPINAIWWFILINGVLCGISGIVSDIFYELVIFKSYASFWYVYSFLLPMVCIVLKVQVRKKTSVI